MKKSIMLLFFFSIILVFSCNSEKKVTEEIGTYLTLNPIKMDTSYISEYICEINSIQNIDIKSKIKGQLLKIYIDEGMIVKKGQSLFKLSTQGYKEEYLKSNALVKISIAEAKKAKLEMENVKILADKNIVSQIEYEKAFSNYEVYLAKIDEAKAHEASALLNIELTEIKAPFDGIINRIPFKEGSMIDENTLLTSLSNNKEIYAYFNVSEKEYFTLNSMKGRKDSNNISLLLANNQIHKYKGKIETVEGEFDKKTGSIAFRSKFPNPELLLRNSSSGKILIKNKIKNAILIPQRSTLEIQDQNYVYVVDNENKVRLRNIKIKMKIPNLYILESGINENDNIIYEGMHLIKEGDKIKSKNIQFNDVISQLKK